MAVGDTIKYISFYFLSFSFFLVRPCMHEHIYRDWEKVSRVKHWQIDMERETVTVTMVVYCELEREKKKENENKKRKQ